MTQVLRGRNRYAAEYRRERFDAQNSTVFQPRERHGNASDMVRPRIINRFCPDWLNLRIWEDDGGQAQLS